MTRYLHLHYEFQQVHKCLTIITVMHPRRQFCSPNQWLVKLRVGSHKALNNNVLLCSAIPPTGAAWGQEATRVIHRIGHYHIHQLVNHLVSY